MRKELDVYNAFFGDCIILKDLDDDTNVLVDFGIHYHSFVSYPYTDRDTLTKNIAEDIANRYSNRNLSLLITHFHEDHVSGLIHMYQSKNPAYKGLFKNIYIANIWDNPFAVSITLLEQMILEHELRKSGLPRTTASLFDILAFLTISTKKNITLLNRGVVFEDGKYVALWPLKSMHIKTFKELDLGLPPELERELEELARITCIFVMRVLVGNEGYEESYTGELSIELLDASYNRLLDDYSEFLSNNNWTNEKKAKLNKLNHEYNVVFQNLEDCDENVLFTGDAEIPQMNSIAKRKDIPLYSDYKYIKIPHHGTDAHYFDFTSYNPQTVIITNGRVIKVKYPDSYKISDQYGSLAATHVCANSNWCENCTFNCATSKSVCAINRVLVYSSLYKTV